MRSKDEFDRIVDALNRAVLDDSFWLQATGRIDEACGARGGLVVLAEDLGRDRTEFYFAKGYVGRTDRSDWRDNYFCDYFPVDESKPRVRRLPHGRIVPMSSIFSEQERRTSRMFNEFLARCRGQNGLMVRQDGRGGSRVMWGIGDPVDTAGWSSSRLQAIGRLLPHLRHYMLIRSALVDAEALGASATELLDNARAGAVQLDPSGRIVRANDRARAMLRLHDGLSDTGGELHAASPADDERLWQLLARAMPRFGEQAAGGSMLVRRPSLRPGLALHVRPVTDGEPLPRSRRVAALVLIVDPAERARIDPDLVAGAFRLTPTETRIAVLLARGRTVGQIASEMDRGRGTVRTHLKNMFLKLGVSRQLELVQLVLALSSLPARPD